LIFLYKNNNEDQSDERDNNSNNKDEYSVKFEDSKISDSSEKEIIEKNKSS